MRRVGRETATRRCSSTSALAAEAGLHPTDYKALTVLDRLGPMSAGELSRHTGLAAASVTNLIERLVAKGLLRREPDPLDRRRALLRADLAKLIGHDVFASWQRTATQSWSVIRHRAGRHPGFSGRHRPAAADHTEALATASAQPDRRQWRP